MTRLANGLKEKIWKSQRKIFERLKTKKDSATLDDPNQDLTPELPHHIPLMSDHLFLTSVTHNRLSMNTLDNSPETIFTSIHQSAQKTNTKTLNKPLKIHTKDTPLNASITQIFNAVKDPKILPTPRPIAAPRDKSSRDKYCAYHKDIDHQMDECLSLKRNIGRAIQNGFLREYINRRNTHDERSSKDTYPPRVTNRISTQHTEREKLQKTTGDIPLVISMHTENFVVRHILVDTESCVNIIYQDALKAMEIPILPTQSQFTISWIYCQRIICKRKHHLTNTWEMECTK